RAELPELPDAKKARFVVEYGLSAYDAEVLVAERASADYFETAARGRSPKLVANWVITELFGALNRAGRDIALSPVTPERLGELVDLIQAGTISGRIAKDVFSEMLESGDAPAAIVEQKGLKQISDSGALEKIIDQLVAANPGQVESYRKNPKALGWFVGQVMRQTQGQANPQLVNQVLKRKLGS
ncbi:MAG TPA: Asp-tRNA(Asn)/Glu-tRNA(Gln) amidotransferase GatCAB subunit B, partial [Geminicoccaceae bacterium]|nr:Asp-tRNA(Asn)/Glu-tRNA(Gln) amidotransferase GatCAB subunit B [Geminicoccaceae bacterium]